MTTLDNVQVHIQVQTKTVLGTVTGSKNLDGTWAKRSTIPEGTPVVTTTAMSGSTTVGPPPAAPPATGPETPVTPVTPATPIKPKPKPPAASGVSDERKAEGLLKMARSYLAAGVNRLGIKKLEECADKYPETKAGKQAKELLKAM